MTERTRFAPSPTGELHIGGVRTALYTFLHARHNDGVFIVRLEDTDQARTVEGSDVRILQTLREFGLDPDEGMCLDETGEALTQKGDFGPYRQSERLAIYKKHAETLLASGHLYQCFCTSERLAELKQKQQQEKTQLGYDGLCKTLSAEEARAKTAEPHVLRFAMPESGDIVLPDLVRGDVVFDAAQVGDFVCVKSDGFPTYHFASVVDDHEMQITTVIRGVEWTSSSPKHLALYDAFGWQPPRFAHLPVLLNPDKTKLSKRQGDVDGIAFIQKGYLPEAIINFIALLGWNPGENEEVYSLEQLIEKFDITKAQKAGAVFNTEKLDWLNRHYFAKYSPEQQKELLMPHFERNGLVAPDQSDEWWEAVVQLEQERIAKFSDVGEESGFLFREISPNPQEVVWKKSSAEETQAVLAKLISFLQMHESWKKEDLETEIKEWITQEGLGNGDVLWPMRVALSGKAKSPDPFTLAEIHQKEKTIRFLQAAHDTLA